MDTQSKAKRLLGKRQVRAPRPPPTAPPRFFPLHTVRPTRRPSGGPGRALVDRRSAWRQAPLNSWRNRWGRRSCEGCGGGGGRDGGRRRDGRVGGRGGGGGGRRSVSSRVRREPVGRHCGGQVARGHAAAAGPAGEGLLPPFRVGSDLSCWESCVILFWEVHK